MKKQLKTTLVLIAIVLFSLVFLAPRLIQCYGYYKLTSRSLNTLSQKPVIIELPKTNLSPNFSLGFAECFIAPNDINSIKFVTFLACTIVDCNDYSFVFKAPFDPTNVLDEEGKKLANEPHKAAKLLKMLEEDPFGSEVRIASVAPKTFLQLFMMSKEDYAEYMLLCLRKIIINGNQKGIGIFKAKNIKGIIRFGGSTNSNRMLAEIFSNDYPLGQEITVSSKSPEKTKEMLLALLASYDFSITEAPEESALRKLVLDSISAHPKFSLYPESE